eukprot:TRINITY_DN3550_c1_g1_i7.p3 TRINITY_DN3550_c1_g1~~TRINITY_DN3550_c1_g1_i7.p3  ORF type:complete len:211 (-),score=20.58 TRINITY_DN3550_c1_g1_i7:207-839(-)
MMQTQIWTQQEVASWKSNYNFDQIDDFGALSKYNPSPGTGRTGFTSVPPNNYPFYSEEEKYVPVMQTDGGQLSEWEPMYNPSPEQAEEDRRKAYETGIPHGYVAPGDKYKGLPTIKLNVVSLLHVDDEYGINVNADGKHSGGPFTIEVSPKMRIEDLRLHIYKIGGIIPALQKLSYADRDLEDSQRSLEQYGVAYWHKKFPHWSLKIRKF